MKRNIVILMFVAVLGVQLSAQESKDTRSGNKNWEQRRIERADYISSALKLTEAEKAKFVPVLDEYMKERFLLYRKHKEEVEIYRKKTTKLEADYDAMIQSHLDSEKEKLKLESEFLVKLRKILSAEKTYRYKGVEHDFMHKVLDRRKENKRGRHP